MYSLEHVDCPETIDYEQEEQGPDLLDNASETQRSHTQISGTIHNLHPTDDNNNGELIRKLDGKHDSTRSWKPGITIENGNNLVQEQPETYTRSEEEQTSMPHFETNDEKLNCMQTEAEKEGGDRERNTLFRRSEEASLLLGHGNPSITDLTDKNRPTKLAEKFSELYSNEHTDALEELHMLHIDEKRAVSILLNVIKDAYYFCSERASDERNRLMSVMKNVPAATSNENPSKTETLRKGIVAQRLKDNASSLSTRILKEFFDSRLQSLIPDGTTESQNPRLLKYVQVCVEIVWWMCVQDPPIYLSWIEETERREFDKDEYRSYTKSGKTVDFCVWPLVHLCKGGPILAKGIAQGK